ncbi:MAG TPA: radical SAM protein [Stellaceae bacterium]|nr:radical SAM protein [Stellaceae bacterium]
MAAERVVRMDGPVLVFGGPYSNLEATEAVLAEARRLAIPPERIVCTGDIVAYGADALATVAAVRAAGIAAIMGNCEESLAANSGDCGCGYAEGSACERLASEWYAHADRTLDAESRRWMGALPRRLVIEVGGRRLAVVHGGTRRINRFLFASTPEPVLREELAASAADGVIAGHSGIPFSEIVGSKLWHNAGAIGMPANDATPRAWFSLLIPTGQGLRIEHRALSYDHRAAAGKMRAAGLPAGYADALETGLWPSVDVLPAAEAAATGKPIEPGTLLWPRVNGHDLRLRWPAEPIRVPSPAPLAPEKFRDPATTVTGEKRATVELKALETLWFNTGTLCNIACKNCYIESSPRNDRLEYLTQSELGGYLAEIARDRLPTREIGFTGGEPFMNPEIVGMLEDCLAAGFKVLVLTNAMRPMQRLKAPLLDLRERFGSRLALRVSLDHHTRELHEAERGADTWQPTLDGLLWLARNGFEVSVAGRLMWGEGETAARQGFAALFERQSVAIDAEDRDRLVLFPEMDARLDVPELGESCWEMQGIARESLMCATSRMVVKRKGAARPAVLACTLVPYDPAFELGTSLSEAAGSVALNHPHCAKFCVLGRGACSPLPT